MAGENETKEIYEGYEEAKNPATHYGNCIFAGTMDGENYGFYLPDAVLDEKGNVRLLDFVILTNKEHMELMDGQGTGKVITFHKGAKPTLEDPPPPSDVDLAKEARQKRDALIDKVEWRIQRYQQQIALGVVTADTSEYYGKLLTYVQALRDVPKQSGFPRDVVFPELPE